MEQHHHIMDKLGDLGGRTYIQTSRHAGMSLQGARDVTAIIYPPNVSEFIDDKTAKQKRTLQVYYLTLK